MTTSELSHLEEEKERSFLQKQEDTEENFTEHMTKIRPWKKAHTGSFINESQDSSRENSHKWQVSGSNERKGTRLTAWHCVLPGVH